MKTLWPVIVCLGFLGCSSKETPDSAAGSMQIRKQVFQLTIGDLREHPIWQFALDEDGEKGQDEATVRPYDAQGTLDSTKGMFIVRARFTLADGTPHVGYLTPSADAHDLGTVQPQIVTDNGQVGFWMGVVRQDVASSYSRLGKTAAQTFPVSFESDVPLKMGPFKGSIPAFLHLPSVKAMKAEEVK